MSRRPAGYSGTPLAKKLGIVAGARVHARGAPRDYRALLAPLPEGVVFVARAGATTDIVHAFFRRRADLDRSLSAWRKLLRDDATIWVSWPKRASGVDTDITEDAVRDAALPLGFVDVKVCAVDATWSGLKLVLRRESRGRP
jgi:hypothetical protein